MLDMGGMPSASTSKAARSIDASKNCKVRCVAFDFDLLTRSTQKADAVAAAVTAPPAKSSANLSEPVTPDVGMVEQMSNLLGVKLGGSSQPLSKVLPEDDLSALLGDDDVDTSRAKKQQEKQPSSNPLASMDIRNKYASKLRNKVEGGVPGIELAKSQVDESLSRGDAAGHLSARAMAVQSGNSETKWMALTGTGALLTYLSNRSLKIALLPKPSNVEAETEGKRMNDFTRQLPNIPFDCLLEEGDDVSKILDELLDGLSTDALSTMVISDRDDYLRSAKEAGMTTCRVRANTNAPRGNVSAHYNVTSMAEVQDVVNEVNGISFNAVFAAR